MPLTRDQIVEVRSVPKTSLKQIWQDDTSLENIIDKVSTGVLAGLNARHGLIDLPELLALVNFNVPRITSRSSISFHTVVTNSHHHFHSPSNHIGWMYRLWLL
ncbi:hypothetical protein JTB14_036032 [Gonioctena quinquepunctata]|nr:hypothetical protein JTB14_036032 [Gonioctena quinquepunctata]